MKVLVLGGDGFCGWPTSLHLSRCGHEVVIVDNFARRDADLELQAPSLTPIAPLATRLDPRLINRFDYDGDYGTVLNRFLIQSALGHPLTVHGIGGQTRAFINIQDTVRCIDLALQHPPRRGERVRILNQMTETWRVRDLAGIVADLTGADVAYLPNPRAEADENELKVENGGLLGLGLKPITLHEGLLAEIAETARAYVERADVAKVPCLSTWNAERAMALADPEPQRRAAE